ncbi:S8 family serine peptidase [Anaerobacillus sp. CMMVII]|uniref:cell wall-binding repeat-containing protein n=1 Tax=Anaerobacillus sp. CMMVII TaxID=2755588 RepID=UPI0021B750D8|nr:cell wall-binding repeat-containing protein [Anaerobacillus sp. CMMVII]MCT8140231.1 S8 family serine peptidase [Anaerobacillus sp. CMMVII]
MGKFRKQLASLLVFLLVFSNFSFVGAVGAQGKTNLDVINNILQQQLEDVETLDGDATVAAFAATDSVRVIVELKGETPIEYATKKDVLFKELSDSEKQSLTNKVLQEQTTVKNALASEGVIFDYKYNFTTSFNGFSGDVLFGDVAKIENLPQVSKVYLANEYNRPEVEPNMDKSHQFIQSIQTWADGQFKGEGMVVAVLDTGVDPVHKDFNISDGVDVALTEDGVNAILSENNINGKYFNEKVPFGYNYFDLNNQILDLGPHASHHGMHVAGTVVANGAIMGVAPEAQVLGMKVFSNDPNYPSTTSDVYLAAIDDSVKLGADVLNMSLGSIASFYDANSAEDVAITRAVDNGVVAAVSAGNSGHILRGYSARNPFHHNPDIGVVGAPGLNYDTIQVAASGNEAYLYQTAITVEGSSYSAVGYGMDSWVDLDGLELVDLGEKLGGSLADYDGVDVAGKVVVVPRGAFSFIAKVETAAAAGATGIIVRNNDPSLFFWENQGGWDIPFMHVQFQDGKDLQAAIAAGHTTLKTNELSRKEDVEMGRMTDFTSWGTTPSLELKPELTAPGGNIYSTIQGDAYGVKSGTSMAAPHVAGGAALVQQYLKSDERFASLTASERTRLAKALLMNSGYVIEDLNGQPFSPRRQGAGMMSTYYAVTTPVVVTYKETNEAKVELYDFDKTNVDFTLVAENLTNEAVTYTVDTQVLTDTFREMASGPKQNALIAGDFIGAVVNAPETVTVPAGGSVEFTVAIDFSEAKIPGLTTSGQATSMDLVKNIFVEGFVNLTADQQPSLSVPFLGFYGDWSEPSILDGLLIFNEARQFTPYASDVVNAAGQFVPFLTDDKGDRYHVINPAHATMKAVNPITGYLRNAREVQINILDTNEKLLRRVLQQTDVRKNYFNAGNAQLHSWVTARGWDGTVRNQLVADGKYFYEIKAVADKVGAKWQSKKVPVLVDTTAPVVTIDSFDKASNTIKFTATDAGIGVNQIFVFVGEGNDPVATLDAGTTSYTFASPVGIADVAVYATDKVNNVGFTTGTIGDTVEPLVFLSSPGAFSAHRTHEVTVAGYATDNDRVASVSVNGKKVDLTYNEENKRYSFSTVLTFEKDGIEEIIVTALDAAGNEFSIARRVYLDTQAPTIKANVAKFVNHDVTEVPASFLLEDNFHYLSFLIDGSQEYLLPSTNVAGGLLNGASKTFETTLEVKPGNNKFELRLVDYAGNVTTQELNVYRNEVDYRVDRLAGQTRFDTAVNVSKEGWETSNVVIISRSDDFTDALSGAPLAKKHDAPILLTNTKSLSKATAAEIARLGATEVIILGGELAVSAAVEAELKALVPNVKRISGKTRWETSALIAHEVAPEGSSEAVVVYGRDYADALAIAPYAAAKGMPILLTDKEKLPKATADALVALNVETTYALGGHLVMSDDVFNALPGGERFAGKTRFDTALMVVEKFNQGAEHFYVATTNDFTDALAGAALAAKKDTGIFLVGNSVRANLKTYIAENGVETLTVLGGELAISAELFAELAGLYKN